MSERATVFEDTILGVEVTPGVAVPVTKRLTSTSVNAQPELTTRRFRPEGRKLDTQVIPARRSSSATVEGVGTFYDICYILASIFGKKTGVLVPTATGVYDWTFEITPNAPDTPQTYTVETGSSVRAAKFSYGVFTEMNMSFTADEVSTGGSMIGQLYTDGATKTTSGVTATGDTPIIPDDTDVFLDTTLANIGTTKLLRALGVSLSIGNKVNPLWVMNSANPSWVVPVELAPDLTMTLTVAADAAGMALLSASEQGATRYVKVLNTGPTIATTFKHEIEITAAVKVEALNSLADNEGIYAAEWGLRSVDVTGLAGMKVRVRNAMATL